MIGTKATKRTNPLDPTIVKAALAGVKADPAELLPTGVDSAPLADAVSAPTMRGPSIWERLDEATGGKRGAGAFLRGAGALFNGDGVGGAIAAGTGFMDQRRHEDTAAQQQQFDNDLASLRQRVDQQQADQTGNFNQGQLTNDALRIMEASRHNRAGESIDANGQRVQLYGIDTGAATQRRGQDVDRANTITSAETARRGQDLNYDASIYGDNINYLNAGQRADAAGIGSRAYTQMQTKTPAVPASNGFFGMGATPGAPATVTTTRIPVAPAAAGGATPPPAAVAALKANPNLRGQFEAKYGAGSAAQYLGGR